MRPSTLLPRVVLKSNLPELIATLTGLEPAISISSQRSDVDAPYGISCIGSRMTPVQRFLLDKFNMSSLPPAGTTNTCITTDLPICPLCCAGCAILQRQTLPGNSYSKKYPVLQRHLVDVSVCHEIESRYHYYYLCSTGRARYELGWAGPGRTAHIISYHIAQHVPQP